MLGREYKHHLEPKVVPRVVRSCAECCSKREMYDVACQVFRVMGSVPRVVLDVTQ